MPVRAVPKDAGWRSRWERAHTHRERRLDVVGAQVGRRLEVLLLLDGHVDAAVDRVPVGAGDSHLVRRRRRRGLRVVVGVADARAGLAAAGLGHPGAERRGLGRHRVVVAVRQRLHGSGACGLTAV